MKPVLFSRPFLLAAGVALAVLAVPVAGQAGFQIRGNAIPQTPPLSGGALQSDTTLAPIGMMPDASGAPTVPVTAVPLGTVSPALSQTDTLEGFGTDLPLVIALQQVAPPGYQFAFAPGIDPGQRVSWQGGKPWREVATEMLAANGLSFEVQGDNVLSVTTQGGDLQTVAVTPPTAPEDKKPLQTADIRRTKPSGMINRLRAQLSRDEAASTPVSAPDNRTAEWDEAERDAAADLPAAPAAEALTAFERQEDVAQEDLSPISLAPVAPTVQSAPPSPPPVVAAPIVRPPQATEMPVVSEAVATPVWQADAGATLRDVVAQWAERAGVELYWTIDYDYRLTRPVSAASFADAVTQALDQFATVTPRPYARLHQAAGTQQTLVVKAYGVAE